MTFSPITRLPVTEGFDLDKKKLQNYIHIINISIPSIIYHSFLKQRCCNSLMAAVVV